MYIKDRLLVNPAIQNSQTRPVIFTDGPSTTPSTSQRNFPPSLRNFVPSDKTFVFAFYPPYCRVRDTRKINFFLRKIGERKYSLDFQHGISNILSTPTCTWCYFEIKFISNNIIEFNRI